MKLMATSSRTGPTKRVGAATRGFMLIFQPFLQLDLRHSSLLHDGTVS